MRPCAVRYVVSRTVPEDGTPKRIVFSRQCYAPCSWHIHKRDRIRHAGIKSVRLQLLAHPKKRSNTSRKCKSKRDRRNTGRALVFVVPVPCRCDAKQPSMRMSQPYRNSAHQGVSPSCSRASSMASTSPSFPLSMQVAPHALIAFICLSPSPALVALDAAAAIHRRRKRDGDRNCSQRHSDGRF